jgi:hypothetical protein
MKNFVFSLSILFSLSFIAQNDYLLLKNGDMLWIKKLSSKNGKISYTIPDDKSDTTVYSISKKEVRKYMPAWKIEASSIGQKMKLDSTKSVLPLNTIGIDFGYVAVSSFKFDYNRRISKVNFTLGGYFIMNARPQDYFNPNGYVLREEYVFDVYPPFIERLALGLNLRYNFPIGTKSFLHVAPGFRSALVRYGILKNEFVPTPAYLEIKEAPGINDIEKHYSIANSFFGQVGFQRTFGKMAFIDVNFSLISQMWNLKNVSYQNKIYPEFGLVVGFRV